MSAENFKFHKKERLSSVSEIKKLFNEGRSFVIFPFKIIYLLSNSTTPDFRTVYHNQILISVPKKKFKKAVDRNKLKRRIKEIYRLQNKSHLTKSGLKVVVIYLSDEFLPFNLMENKLISCFQRLTKL